MSSRSRCAGCLGVTLLAALGLVVTACTFDPTGISAPELCGDGVATGDEACDVADLEGATCDSLGYGTGTLACASDCTFDTTGCTNAPVCGDGTVDPGEECDDGNTVAGDGCDPLCLIETPPECGNWNIDAGEECDDGNTVDCDGCSTSCTYDGCGSGTIDCGEVCDANDVTSSCAALGYHSGTLGCNATCDGYDTSLCIRNDGQDCTNNHQCVGNICFQESEGFPLGYCTSSCVDDGSCTDGVCRSVPGGDSCYRTCATSADCRPEYYCRIDPWNQTDLVCRPLCTSDADCPITGLCNVYTGRCNHTSTGAGDNGAPCIDRDDCLGSRCITNLYEGYCVSECNLADPICPGDGVCSDIVTGSVGDRGYCLDGCHTGGDCTRQEYSCQPNPYGSDNVCLD